MQASKKKLSSPFHKSTRTRRIARERDSFAVQTTWRRLSLSSLLLRYPTEHLSMFAYKCLRKNEGECPTTTALGLELVVRSSTIGCQTCHFHPLYTSLSISSCKLATWGAVSCWFLQAFDIWPNEETKYNWDYHSDFLITLYESYHQ